MLQLLQCLLLATGAAALIPREKLISDSTTAYTLTDGKEVGYIQQDSNKIKNVFTWRVWDRHKRQITFGKRDVLDFEWTNGLILLFNNTRFAVNKIYVDNKLKIRLVREQLDDGRDVFYRVSSTADPEHLTFLNDDWEEYFRVKTDDCPITNILEDFTLLAYTENYHYPKLITMSDTVEDDLEYLKSLREEGFLHIRGTSNDMRTWLVTFISAEHPTDFFIFHRGMKSAEFLFNARPSVQDVKQNKQIGFGFAARDDLIIQAYLSLPIDNSSNVSEEDRSFAEQGMIPAEPQKMVGVVHGGPDSRDAYATEHLPINVLLTSRSYVVLQVNFRGSSGFGKQLRNASNGEFSWKMHDELIDAVDFAVSKGIANRSAVAIMGTSYGGYVGLTFTPDTFACGIDVVGPSNLITLLETIPPYWKGIRKDLVKRLGADFDTEEGRRELIARSPLFIANRVKKPLMIMQGANDPRVKERESEQFVAAMKNHSIPVTYVLYPNEGHGFRCTENRLSELGYIEKFLHNCLGGEYQPYTNGEYNESAIVKSDGFALNANKMQTIPGDTHRQI